MKIPVAFDERSKSLPIARITYENQMRLFMEFIQPLSIHEITKETVDRYMGYLVGTRKVSVSTQNTAINAIKFYLEQVKGTQGQDYAAAVQTCVGLSSTLPVSLPSTGVVI